MPAIWDMQWGHVPRVDPTDDTPAVVIGEWGGRYTGLDRYWQETLSEPEELSHYTCTPPTHALYMHSPTHPPYTCTLHALPYTARRL